MSIESIKEGIVEGWLTWLLILIATWLVLCGVRGLLYAFGKEHLLTPERRKAFYGVGSVFVFCFLIVVQLVLSRLADIAAASPRKGGFRAGLILLAPISNIVNRTSTNPIPTSIPTSMSGIGNAQSKWDEKGATMLVVMKIDNSGQPSVAWNWKVSIGLRGGSEIDAVIPSVSLVTSNPLPTVIGPYLPTMEDNLIQSMAVSPLPTGGGKIGWIPFNVAGFNELPEGSQVTVSFEDVFGRKTTLKHRWEKGK